MCSCEGFKQTRGETRSESRTPRTKNPHGCSAWLPARLVFRLTCRRTFRFSETLEPDRFSPVSLSPFTAPSARSGWPRQRLFFSRRVESSDRSPFPGGQQCPLAPFRESAQQWRLFFEIAALAHVSINGEEVELARLKGVRKRERERTLSLLAGRRIERACARGSRGRNADGAPRERPQRPRHRSVDALVPADERDAKKVRAHTHARNEPPGPSFSSIREG